MNILIRSTLPVLAMIFGAAVSQAQTHVVDYGTWLANGQGARIILNCNQPLDGVLSTMWRTNDHQFGHLISSVKFADNYLQLVLPDGERLTVKNSDCQELSTDGLPSPH